MSAVRTFSAGLAALAVSAAGLIPATAAADCCGGPWVSVTANRNAPLAASVRLTITQDDPDHRYSATVRPSLSVGRKFIHRFAPFDVSNVGPTKQYRNLKVPRAVREAAAEYGARTGHRRAVLKFVIVNATEMTTGDTIGAFGMDSYLLLPKPKRPS